MVVVASFVGRDEAFFRPNSTMAAAAVVPLFYFDLKVYMYAFGLTVLVFWGHWIEIQGDDDDYEKKPGKTRSHSTTSVRPFSRAASKRRRRSWSDPARLTQMISI